MSASGCRNNMRRWIKVLLRILFAVITLGYSIQCFRKFADKEIGTR